MRYLLLLPIIVFLSLFHSCGTESTPTYILTTTVVGEGTITPSGGTYEEGETVIITSTPSQHWIFDNWSGDGTGSSSTVTITMDRDKSVVGNFQRRDYPLTITIEGEGTVGQEVVQSKTTDYPYQTVVQLTPKPSDGWRFVEWSGGVTSTDEVVTVTVDGEVNVKVHFQDICDFSDGIDNKFEYTWSLSSETVTVTNQNQCDNLYIWATSTPLCDGCVNTVIPSFSKISSGETVVLAAAVPASLSWKPDLIYSNQRGDTFVFRQKQAGSSVDHHLPLILLDYSDHYEGHIKEFENMFRIGSSETIRGDCENFSWIDREKGKFQVTSDPQRNNSYCFVGNIEGYTDSGDRVWLPHTWYFVTDKSQRN